MSARYGRDITYRHASVHVPRTNTWHPVAEPEPEPWQTNAARPAMLIEKPKGIVSVSALGKEQFRVEAPGHDSEVEGYQEARALAHEFAEGLE